MANTRLTYIERLQVSWLIAWRYFVMVQLFSRFLAGVLLFGLAGVLSILGLPRPVIGWIADAVIFIVPFLVFYPFIIGMVLNKQFRGFSIELIDGDGSVHSPGFIGCLLPGSIFAVATYVSLMLAGTILGTLYPQFLYPRWWSALVFAVLWHVLVAYPVILGMVLRMRFKDFRFEVIRAEEPTETEPLTTSH